MRVRLQLALASIALDTAIQGRSADVARAGKEPRLKRALKVLLDAA